MLRALSLFVVGVCANVLVGLPAFAQSPAEVTVPRIDCGTGATSTDVAQRFTDTFAYKDLELTFTFSCYVIEHCDEYMVWDTGFAPGTSPTAPKVAIVARLRELEVTPEQVKTSASATFTATIPASSSRSRTRRCSSERATGTGSPRQRQCRARMSRIKSWIDEKRSSRWPWTRTYSAMAAWSCSGCRVTRRAIAPSWSG